MEHSFRIALCMFLLIGYLQANPVTSKMDQTDYDDLGLDLLLKVSCNNNVTFSSPTNVQGGCHTAALKVFKEELEKAIKSCDDKRISDTIEALENKLLSNKQTQCNLTMTVHETFQGFVEAFRTLVELIKVSPQS